MIFSYKISHWADFKEEGNEDSFKKRWATYKKMLLF